ncbi:MAG: Tad domain-containing protein, partial [bacterium]|nr:Tad domain-containing protein [bacterium]
MLKSLQNLHSDQRGSLSLTSMFALIVLVMLLGMIINSGRQVHRKIQLQNAADSATYTGGVVLARGMNALAFSNHLLCDVFALNAFMREGAARRAESLTPEILANWERVGPEFVGSEFPRFDKLGLAINEKVPHESNMVLTWSEWSAAASEMMLPVLDAILEERMIPEYQTSVAYSTPRLAQYAATDIAFRHADRWPTNESASASLWRTNVDGGGPDPIDGAANDFYLTMPVADPVDAAGLLSNAELNEYQDRAIDERFRYSHTYLDQWNDDSLYTFDRYGKMSQFASLWRIFVGG